MPCRQKGKAWPRETAERADRCLGSAGRSFSFCCYGEPHGLPAEIDGSVGAVEVLEWFNSVTLALPTRSDIEECLLA